jgi:anti-sigma B factor antagonist
MDGHTASERTPFSVLIDRSGDRVLLALSGEFAVDAGKRFEEAVEEVERERVAQLIVDLGGITFMDTTAAFLLLDLYNRFKANARVTFEGGSPQVQRMFEASGLGAALPIGFPGAPQQAPHGGPDQDWSANPTHPHHAHPYIGLPRRDMPPRRRP